MLFNNVMYQFLDFVECEELYPVGSVDHDALDFQSDQDLDDGLSSLSVNEAQSNDESGSNSRNS